MAVSKEIGPGSIGSVVSLSGATRFAVPNGMTPTRESSAARARRTNCNPDRVATCTDAAAGMAWVIVYVPCGQLKAWCIREGRHNVPP